MISRTANEVSSRRLTQRSRCPPWPLEKGPTRSPPTSSIEKNLAAAARVGGGGGRGGGRPREGAFTRTGGGRGWRTRLIGARADVDAVEAHRARRVDAEAGAAGDLDTAALGKGLQLGGGGGCELRAELDGVVHGAGAEDLRDDGGEVAGARAHVEEGELGRELQLLERGAVDARSGEVLDPVAVGHVGVALVLLAGDGVDEGAAVDGEEGVDERAAL